MSALDQADIKRVFDGDAASIVAIRAASHDVLVSAWQQAEKPVLSAAAVHRVLGDLMVGKVEPASVQLWASFMMRGYVEQVGSAVRPIDIEYEPEYENSIVEAIAVLEQIGDSVDGDPNEARLSKLMEPLSTDRNVFG